MNDLVMSWHTDDGRVVCRWSESKDSGSEIRAQTDMQVAQQSDYWNADVVFELGDAA